MMRTGRRSMKGALVLLALGLGCDEAAKPPGSVDAARDGATAAPDDGWDAAHPPDMAYIIPDATSDGINMAPDGMPMTSDAAPLVIDAAPEAQPPDARTPDAAPATTAADCFDGLFDGELTAGPDYDRFAPLVGSHCAGTDHQRIEGIERVVFVGDSVTVGTPPQDPSIYYRVLLAQRLAERFELVPPDFLWWQVNLIDGVGLVQESGDFAHCARYGARTDDLLRDGDLLTACVPADKRHLRTLFVMTMGGNDVASITQDGIDGVAAEDLWAETEEFVGLLRDAMRWVRAPDRFPNGAFVIFANMFEFTDGTGDVTACPAAGLAGFGAEWDDPNLLAEMVVWANEQYLSIAVEYGVDMIFMLEHFCGHGFNFDDPTAPCYRGPDAELWFDLTCIHPNPLGHRAIADLFDAVVGE